MIYFWWPNSDRFIPTSNWEHENNCYRIASQFVHDYLGHSINDYSVEGLFSTMTEQWLEIELQADMEPKR